jgi:hypothetical protein
MGRSVDIAQCIASAAGKGKGKANPVSGSGGL